jgi:hypothetical protein
MLLPCTGSNKHSFKLAIDSRYMMGADISVVLMGAVTASRHVVCQLFDLLLSRRLLAKKKYTAHELLLLLLAYHNPSKLTGINFCVYSNIIILCKSHSKYKFIVS